MEPLDQYTISETATLLQAVEKISVNRSRAVIVMSGDKVVGMISEGDIMRALLRNVDIHSPLKSMLVYSFKFLTRRDMAEAFELLKKHLLTLLPVLDDEFRLVDVVTLRDILGSTKINF